MKVWLDGLPYELRAGTGVKRTPLIEWPDNIRLDGQQQRKDRRYLSSWAVGWSAGLGIQEMNVDNANEANSIWDAENVDTRNPRQVVLAPAFNTCTLVPSRGDLDFLFEFQRNIYFAESARASYPGGFAYQYSPPFTVGSFRRVFDYVPSWNPDVERDIRTGSISAIKEINGNLIVAARSVYGIAGGGEGSWNKFLVVPTLGGSPPDIAPSLSNLGTLGFVRFGELAYAGGTIYLSEHTGLKLQIYSANAFGSYPALVVDKFEDVGSILPPIVEGGTKGYIARPSGIYGTDAPNTVLIDTSRAQDINVNQVIFQNYLYFKSKKSLLRYDGTDVVSVGYDKRDGLPSDKFGEITAMVSSWQSTFAAVKGATYSHILSMDASHAWQYYARVPTPGLWIRKMVLSDAPDAIDRLWVLFGNYAIPGYFLNPMTNPLNAGTYSYVPTGEFTLPRHDGGLSEIPGGYFDIALSGDALSPVNRVQAFYGLDGAAPVTTLGMVSSLSQALVFGSPAGVKGYKIQPKFMLTGSPAGTTPVFRKAILHYLKDPDRREIFEFDIDLEKTKASEQRSLEAIIGSLSYVGNVKTLLPFHYGQIGTKYVKVIDQPAQENITEDDVFPGERKGIQTIRVAQIT